MASTARQCHRNLNSEILAPAWTVELPFPGSIRFRWPVITIGARCPRAALLNPIRELLRPGQDLQGDALGFTRSQRYRRALADEYSK